MRIICPVILVLFLVAPMKSQAQAGQQQEADSFAAFWAKFKTAVAKNDREAVAAMTKLPFLLENQELAKEGFLKNYDSLFTRRVKVCLPKARPIKEGDIYAVFCGKQIFYFGQVEGEYKFTEIGADY